MSYKHDNAGKMRALSDKWRADAEAEAFERAVEARRFNARVKAEAKMRDTLARLDADKPKPKCNVAAHVAYETLVVLGRVCKFAVVGTLVVLGALVAAIVGASRHR